MDLFVTVVSVLLFIQFVIDIFAWGIIFQVWKDANVNARGGPTALKERFVVASTMAIASTFTGLISADRLLIDFLPNGIPFFLLVLALLINSIPSLYWLRLYYTGKFGTGK